MKLLPTSLPDVKRVQLDVFEDERGAFAETFDSAAFRGLGLSDHFVQDSWSISRRAGTVRGLHFQVAPHAQAKLVRVTRGRIFDVVVDIRQGSPTFGEHVAMELSADVPCSLWVPVGFAHGFCTLEDNSEVTYKMSDHYVADSYRGLHWADRELGIRWPVPEPHALLSPRDRNHPCLAEISSAFSYCR